MANPEPSPVTLPSVVLVRPGEETAFDKWIRGLIEAALALPPPTLEEQAAGWREFVKQATESCREIARRELGEERAEALLAEAEAAADEAVERLRAVVS